MGAHWRVTNNSLKGLFVASCCVFRVDLVILACSEVYSTRFFLGTCGCGVSERWSLASNNLDIVYFSSLPSELEISA